MISLKQKNQTIQLDAVLFFHDRDQADALPKHRII